MRKLLATLTVLLLFVAGCEPDAIEEGAVDTSPEALHIDTVLDPERSIGGQGVGHPEFGPTGRHQESVVAPDAAQRPPADGQPMEEPDPDG